MYSKIAASITLLAALILLGCSRKGASKLVIHRAGEPDVINVDSEDPQMNVAIAKARETKGAFLQALTSPRPDQTDFSAKRPYTTKDGSTKEHIWISHLSFDGELLHGIVGDDPVSVRDLKLNDPVSFPPDELSDWMYLEDGKVVGGFTIRVLHNRMSGTERAEFDRHLQFKD